MTSNFLTADSFPLFCHKVTSKVGMLPDQVLTGLFTKCRGNSAAGILSVQYTVALHLLGGFHSSTFRQGTSDKVWLLSQKTGLNRQDASTLLESSGLDFNVAMAAMTEAEAALELRALLVPSKNIQSAATKPAMMTGNSASSWPSPHSSTESFQPEFSATGRPLQRTELEYSKSPSAFAGFVTRASQSSTEKHHSASNDLSLGDPALSRVSRGISPDSTFSSPYIGGRSGYMSQQESSSVQAPRFGQTRANTDPFKSEAVLSIRNWLHSPNKTSEDIELAGKTAEISLALHLLGADAARATNVHHPSSAVRALIEAFQISRADANRLLEAAKGDVDSAASAMIEAGKALGLQSRHRSNITNLHTEFEVEDEEELWAVNEAASANFSGKLFKILHPIFTAEGLAAVKLQNGSASSRHNCLSYNVGILPDLPEFHDKDMQTNSHDRASIILKLDVDYSTISNMYLFEKEIKEDVSIAARIQADKVTVRSIRAGSVIVDLEVEGDGGRSAIDIAHQLQEQLKMAVSPLRRGRHTKKAVDLLIQMPESNLATPTDSSRSPPKDEAASSPTAISTLLDVDRIEAGITPKANSEAKNPERKSSLRQGGEISSRRNSEFLSQKSQAANEMIGLGLGLKRSELDGRTYIMQMVPGMAAAKSGQCEVNDIILSIDGAFLRDLSMDDIKRLTVGKEGTTCTLTILRKDQDSSHRLIVTLTRSKPAVPIHLPAENLESPGSSSHSLRAHNHSYHAEESKSHIRSEQSEAEDSFGATDPFPHRKQSSQEISGVGSAAIRRPGISSDTNHDELGQNMRSDFGRHRMGKSENPEPASGHELKEKSTEHRPDGEFWIAGDLLKSDVAMELTSVRVVDVNVTQNQDPGPPSRGKKRVSIVEDFPQIQNHSQSENGELENPATIISKQNDEYSAIEPAYREDVEEIHAHTSQSNDDSDQNAARHTADNKTDRSPMPDGSLEESSFIFHGIADSETYSFSNRRPSHPAGSVGVSNLTLEMRVQCLSLKARWPDASVVERATALVRLKKELLMALCTLRTTTRFDQIDVNESDGDKKPLYGTVPGLQIELIVQIHDTQDAGPMVASAQKLADRLVELVAKQDDPGNRIAACVKSFRIISVRRPT